MLRTIQQDIKYSAQHPWQQSDIPKEGRENNLKNGISFQLHVCMQSECPSVVKYGFFFSLFFAFLRFIFAFNADFQSALASPLSSSYVAFYD